MSNLRKLRNLKGLTQEGLAAKVGLTKHNISDYEIERSEPDNKTLILLADFFGVSVDYLIGRTNSMKVNNTPQLVYKSDLHKEIYEKISLLSSEDLLFIKRILDTLNVDGRKTHIR